MTDTRIIKKYPNRRLYDTGLSRYVTLHDVRKLVADDVDFMVLEQRSGADITRSVLLQVIAEQELGAAARLSEAFLAELIRSYELAPAAATAAHLEGSLRSFLAAGGAEQRRS